MWCNDFSVGGVTLDLAVVLRGTVSISLYKLRNVCSLCLPVIGSPSVLWWRQQLPKAVDSPVSVELVSKQRVVSHRASTSEGEREINCVIQWNLSIVDTFGTQLAVLYKEVSLIQIQIRTQLYVVGTADSVLIERCPLFRASFIERFHCTKMGTYLPVFPHAT